MIFDIKIMSSTRPPCGLTKQEVMALDERERVLVVDGRCQNGYNDAEGDHICGKFVGAHPSELAGGKNSFSCSILSPFRLLPFNMFSTRMYILLFCFLFFIYMFLFIIFIYIYTCSLYQEQVFLYIFSNSISLTHLSPL